MKNRKQIGLLLSGGLDSAALAAYLLQKNYTVWPVYVRCDLRWEKNELYWTKRFLKSISHPQLKPLTSLHLSLEKSYDNNWSKKGKIPNQYSPDQAVFLPARNLLLVTKACLFLNSKNITSLALATLKGNPFPDGNQSYFNQLSRVLSMGFGRPISIKTPFKTFHKFDVIRKVKDTPLHLSLSCINPVGHHHCGKCNKCAERKRAFSKANSPDKTLYLN